MKPYTITNSKTGKTMQLEANSLEEASLKALEDMGFVVEEVIKPIKDDIYFFSSHMDRNFVKVGDRVEQYKTKIGTIGRANYPVNLHVQWAHDHMGAMKKGKMTEEQLVDLFYQYIFGWSKEMIKKYYLNPHKLDIDFKKMYPETRVDVGQRGYDWLQNIYNKKGQLIGYHPGVDVNDKRGGNSDFGQPIMAPCNGVVIHEVRTWFSNHGFGNVIIIKKD